MRWLNLSVLLLKPVSSRPLPPVWFYLLEVKQNIRYALANLTQFCSNKRLERNN